MTMTLQQLQVLCTVVERGLNFSRTAAALNTTQPAISRMIRSLEQEMGAELMVRSGTRIVRLTPQGEDVVERARQILLEVGNLGRVARDRAASRSGIFSIATTHTQACYGLVGVIKKFTALYPDVNLQIRHGAPADITAWVSTGEVDIGVAARPKNSPRNVLTLDAYPIERCIIAPRGHPLLRIARPTPAQIAQYPIVAYDERAQTGALLKSLFEKERIEPRIIVKASDSDVVMSYVEAGIGIALFQKQIVEQERRKGIRAVDISHLIPPTMTQISLRRDAYLRGFMYEFIALVAPQWTRKTLDVAKTRVRRTAKPAAAKREASSATQ
jgi:DNA-binding transcriptional LysR family regulator